MRNHKISRAKISSARVRIRNQQVRIGNVNVHENGTRQRGGAELSLCLIGALQCRDITTSSAALHGTPTQDVCDQVQPKLARDRFS